MTKNNELASLRVDWAEGHVKVTLTKTEDKVSHAMLVETFVTAVNEALKLAGVSAPQIGVLP